MSSGRPAVARVGLFLLAASGCGAAETRDVARRPEAPGPVVDSAELDRSLRAVEEGRRRAPRDRWDPAAVVERAGLDPDSLGAWVREQTTWIPYRGSLRGPVGVLMDRQGNSLDRALLLAALLTRAGHSVRLARADLSAEQARALLPELTATHEGAGRREPAGAELTPVEAVAAGSGPDVDAQVEAGDSLVGTLAERVESQSARLLAAVGGPDPAEEWRARRDSALAALRDHWWVQVQVDGEWRDLDPVGLDSIGGRPSPVESLAPDALPAALRHRVVVRVVAERWEGGAGVESHILEHGLDADALAGQTLLLQLWPTGWPRVATSSGDSGRSARRQALAQVQWQAALSIGGAPAAGGLLVASDAGPAQSPGPLGALGGAIATMGASSSPDSLEGQLTAVWLEYELQVPGRASRTVRRTMFDLAGPEARQQGRRRRPPVLDDAQRLQRSLALMMRTEILILPAQLAPEYVLDLAARGLLASGGLLRAMASPGFGSDALPIDTLLAGARTGVGQLHAFAVLRQDALGAEAVIDRPVIITRHQYPVPAGAGLGFADAVDIVVNEGGVALTTLDGFAARLTQGVWDTNLEAALGLGSHPAGNAALAWEVSDGWTVRTAADASGGGLPLPGDAGALAARDLAEGYTIVAPDGPVAAGGGEFAGWWRIHPETGDALGVAGNGWGQGVTYGMLIGAAADMAAPFVYMYALCQFIPQAANSLNILGNEFWQLGWHPRWVTGPPLEAGKDFEDVAYENNRKCVIEAIIGGFVATAPILLYSMRYKTEWDLTQAARNYRPPRIRGNTLRSGWRPPGTSPKPKGYPMPKTGPGRPPGGGPPPPPRRAPGPSNPKPPAPKAPPAPKPPAPEPEPPTQRNWPKGEMSSDQARALRNEIDYRWNKVTADRVRYHVENGWADYDDPAYQQMVREHNELHRQFNEAQRRLDQALAAEARAAGRSGLQLPKRSVGCPPNCGGNEKVTLPEIPPGDAP